MFKTFVATTAVAAAVAAESTSSTLDVQLTYPLKENNMGFYGSELPPVMETVNDVPEANLLLEVGLSGTAKPISAITVTMPLNMGVAEGAHCVDDDGVKHPFTRVVASDPSLKKMCADASGTCSADEKKEEEKAKESDSDSSDSDNEAEKVDKVNTLRRVTAARTMTIDTTTVPTEENPVVITSVPETNKWHSYRVAISSALKRAVAGKKARLACPVTVTEESIGTSEGMEATFDHTEGDHAISEKPTVSGKISLAAQPLGVGYSQVIDPRVGPAVHDTEDPYKELTIHHTFVLPEVIPASAANKDIEVVMEYAPTFALQMPLAITNCHYLTQDLSDKIDYSQGKMVAHLPVGMVTPGMTATITCSHVLERASHAPGTLNAYVRQDNGEINTADKIWVWHGQTVNVSDTGKQRLRFEVQVDVKKDLVASEVVHVTKVAASELEKALVGVEGTLSKGKPVLLNVEREEVPTSETAAETGASTPTAPTRRYRLHYMLDAVDGDDSDAQLSAVALEFPTIDNGVVDATKKQLGVDAVAKSAFKDIIAYGDHCSDEVPDMSLERDIDCGGKCVPCAIGKRCIADKDCESYKCEGTGIGVAGTCAEPGALPQRSSAEWRSASLAVAGAVMAVSALMAFF